MMFVLSEGVTSFIELCLKVVVVLKPHDKKEFNEAVDGGKNSHGVQVVSLRLEATFKVVLYVY